MIRSPAIDERHPRASDAAASSTRITTPTGGRIEEFDVLRGIAILFVMWLHAYVDPWVAVTGPELFALHLTQLVANSAVPMFLFMSGFLSARDRNTDFASSMAARARRVVLPALVWMTAALLTQAWWAGALRPDLVRAFLLFDIEGQFYYVFVLLALSVALYPLRNVEDRTLLWCVLGAFAANLAMIAWYEANPLTGLWWSVAYRNPLVWVFAFTFGLYVGRTRGHVEFRRGTTVAAATTMLLAALAYFAIGELGGGYPNSYFGVTVFLFGAGGFVVYPAAVRALERRPLGRWLLSPFRALAPYAFGIYLVHQPYFVGAFSKWALEDAPFVRNYLALVWALFAVGAAASIASVVAVNRLFPRFGAFVLGVEAPRAPPQPAPPVLRRHHERGYSDRPLRSVRSHSRSGRG